MEFSYSKKHLVAFQAEKNVFTKAKFPNTRKSSIKLEQVTAWPTMTNQIAEQLNELRNITAPPRLTVQSYSSLT
jgi:hypothetical protein